MAVRRWRSRASGEEIEVDGVRYALVTAGDMAEALGKLAVVLETCGGHGAVATSRIPTGVPDEFVTVGAIVTWMDMTNPKRRAEPDARLEATEAPAEVTAGPEPATGEPPHAGLMDEVGDGLFVDPDAVDTAEIPA